MSRYSKKMILLALSILIEAAICVPKAVFAEEPEKEKVSIKSENGAVYDIKNGVITIDGHVQVTYKGDTITADHVSYLTEKNLLTAEGNVSLRQDGQEVNGSALTYDLKTQTGNLNNAKAKISGEDIHGYIYASGKEIGGSTDHFVIRSGEVTTCDLEYPHYHLEADTIEIFVDDRIVIKKVSYYEGHLKLFYWPSIVIPLKEGTSKFGFPQIGYGQEEGIFIKNSYNYYSSENSNGLLHLDWYQKLGFGYGLDHFFKMPTLKSDGLAKVYYQDNKKTGHGDLSTEFMYNQPIGAGWDSKLGLSFNSTKPGADIRDEGIGLLSLTKKSAKYNGDFSANYRVVKDSGLFQETRAVTRQSVVFSKTLSASMDASYAEQSQSLGAAGESPDTKKVLTYNVGIVDRQSKYTLGLSLQETLNPDRTTSDTITWTNLAKLPELTLNIPDIGLPKSLGRLKLPPIFADLSAGKYREQHDYDPSESTEAARGDLQVGVRNYSVPLGGGFRADLTGIGRYSAYDTENQRAAVTSGVNLVKSVAGGITGRLGYSYQDVWGATPFRFDELTPSEAVSAGVDVKVGAATTSLTASYDYWTRLFGDAIASVRYEPSDKTMISTELRYNPNLNMLRQVSGTVKLKASDKADIDWSAQYSLEKQTIEALRGTVNLKVGQDWKIGYAGQWDSLTQSMSQNDLSLAYHMHCREIRATYSQVSGQFWLEYRLDAFPGGDLKLGGGSDSGLMVDVDGLDLLTQ